MSNPWSFFLDAKDYGFRANLFIRREEADGSVAFVENMVLTCTDDRQPPPAALVDMHTADAKAFLQAAMDEAWKIGLRPTGFADHTNELTAVRYHLEDMRKLAKVKA